MNTLVATVLASVVSMEGLLFTAIDEQQADTDCAQAVVESIAGNFWGTTLQAERDATEEDFGMSVMEIHHLLDEVGLPNEAFWLTWDTVLIGTERFGPAIVHFDRPQGHYAVAVGAIAGRRDTDSRKMLLVADPARGMTIVSSEWWEHHASGAAVLIDAPPDHTVVQSHLETARRRWARLEREVRYAR